MKLQNALLCIDCESLYTGSTRCPQCGSQVSYPLSRALNRPAATATKPAPVRRAFAGPDEARRGHFSTQMQ